ncbi:hypothetical protein D3C84_1055340 [compost metagenome]
MGQHQRGQTAHGVADQMETLDAEMRQHLQRSLQQEGNRYSGQITALAFPAARCVIRDERMTGEGSQLHDVGIIFLGRAKPMQEHNRRQDTVTMYGGNVQLDIFYR